MNYTLSFYQDELVEIKRTWWERLLNKPATTYVTTRYVQQLNAGPDFPVLMNNPSVQRALIVGRRNPQHLQLEHGPRSTVYETIAVDKGAVASKLEVQTP
jgi:hypothetical protein